MNVCASWDHPLIAWDGYSSEPCPLCHALAMRKALEKALVEAQRAQDAQPRVSGEAQGDQGGG